MYDITKRREIAARIAAPEYIPEYRRLLKSASSPYAGLIEPNQKKLAILLVSALLGSMSEEDILRSVKAPVSAQETPKTATPVAKSTKASEKQPEIATAAVKKNAQRARNTQTSTGKTWTTLSSVLPTVCSQIQSIWGAGCTIMKSAWATMKHRQN